MWEEQLAESMTTTYGLLAKLLKLHIQNKQANKQPYEGIHMTANTDKPVAITV